AGPHRFRAPADDPDPAPGRADLGVRAGPADDLLRPRLGLPVLLKAVVEVDADESVAGGDDEADAVPSARPVLFPDGPEVSGILGLVDVDAPAELVDRHLGPFLARPLVAPQHPPGHVPQRRRDAVRLDGHDLRFRLPLVAPGVALRLSVVYH